MNFQKSAQLYQKAKQVMPGGVNSPVRAFRSVGMDPLFIDHAKGAYLYDVDGNRFIDYVGSWGPMILGHADPDVVQGLQLAAESGLSFGAPCQSETKLAELILQFYPSMEMVRMVNSGTEAVMGAVRLARGHTGRNKIIKFAGCYHGHSDFLLVKAGSGAATYSMPDSAGVPAAFTQETLVAEYNSVDQVRNFIDEFPNEIAAILIEPIAGNMGMVLPDQNFLSTLRTLADAAGICLIFDEVMTGFRVALGGCVELYSVEPDILVLGKIVGGGMPVGAYLSSRAIMQKLSPLGTVYQAGTLSGNPLAMMAGIITLSKLHDRQVYADLQEQARYLASGMQQIAEQCNQPFQINQVGAMLGFFFREQPVKNFADALSIDREYYARFFRGMLAKGIYLAPSAFEAMFLSVAHQKSDLDATLAAFQATLQEMQE